MNPQVTVRISDGREVERFIAIASYEHDGAYLAHEVPRSTVDWLVYTKEYEVKVDEAEAEVEGTNEGTQQLGQPIDTNSGSTEQVDEDCEEIDRYRIEWLVPDFESCENFLLQQGFKSTMSVNVQRGGLIMTSVVDENAMTQVREMDGRISVWPQKEFSEWFYIFHLFGAKAKEVADTISMQLEKSNLKDSGMWSTTYQFPLSKKSLLFAVDVNGKLSYQQKLDIFFTAKKNSVYTNLIRGSPFDDSIPLGFYSRPQRDNTYDDRDWGLPRSREKPTNDVQSQYVRVQNMTNVDEGQAQELVRRMGFHDATVTGPFKPKDRSMPGVILHITNSDTAAADLIERGFHNIQSGRRVMKLKFHPVFRFDLPNGQVTRTRQMRDKIISVDTYKDITIDWESSEPTEELEKQFTITDTKKPVRKCTVVKCNAEDIYVASRSAFEMFIGTEHYSHDSPQHIAKIFTNTDRINLKTKYVFNSSDNFLTRKPGRGDFIILKKKKPEPQESSELKE